MADGVESVLRAGGALFGGEVFAVTSVSTPQNITHFLYLLPALA